MPRPSRTLALAASAALAVAGLSGVAARAPAAAPAPPAAPLALRIMPVAGDGVAGLREGAPRLARFADPFGLAIDRAGNVYVADAGANNRIRKIGADGVVSTLAGAGEGFTDGAGARAAFHTPSGLALAPDGSLLVADTGNNAIRRISLQGVVSTVAGNGQAGLRDGAAAQAMFNGPLGVAADAAGRIYVADTYNDRVRLIDTDGQVRTVAGSGRSGFNDGPATAARFDTPCALVVDAQGGVLIADTNNRAIRRLHAGQVSTLARSDADAPQALLQRPLSLALGVAGTLYIGDMARGRLLQLGADGRALELARPAPDAAAGQRLVMPAGLALDAAGGVLVADAARHAIVRVAPGRAAPPQPPVPPIIAGPTAWPLAPQQQAHAISGTLGEERGRGGATLPHLHRGLDIPAAEGTPVLASAAAKVSNPLPIVDYGTEDEGVMIGALHYRHLRVGRDRRNRVSDSARFQAQVSRQGALTRIRVKRGARFAVGEPIGSVNGRRHVHLEFRPDGFAANPLLLSLAGLQDRLAPRIGALRVLDAQGNALQQRRDGRLVVRAAQGALRILANADDQISAGRHRLGIYRIGYQILRPDGSAAAAPPPAIDFQQLPFDPDLQDTPSLVYAEAGPAGSYIVTNQVGLGRAAAGGWQARELAPGPYLIRVVAADFAGNRAQRDLAVVLE